MVLTFACLRILVEQVESKFVLLDDAVDATVKRIDSDFFEDETVPTESADVTAK